MNHKQTVAVVLVLLGLAAYFAMFYASPLPSLRRPSGAECRRLEAFQFLLFPEVLSELWFGKPPELAIWDRLPILALAGAELACAFGVGWLLLHGMRLNRAFCRLELVAFSTAAGLNLLSTYTLACGLAGCLHSRFVLLPPVLLAAWASVRFWRRRQASGNSKPLLGPPPRSGGARNSTLPSPERRGPLGLRWLWLAAPFVVVIVLGGVQPPNDFDVREYHLQAPKEFYQRGSVGFLPHNVYASMPLGAEMHCLLAMVAAGDWWLGAVAGKTAMAATTLLAAMALFCAGERFFASRFAGMMAALVYLSTPWIVQLSTSGLIDGVLACYLLLAGYAVLLCSRPIKSRHPESELPSLRLVALAGYLAGAAVSCKYPAVLFVVVPLLVGIVWMSRPRSPRADPGAPGTRSHVSSSAGPSSGLMLGVAISLGSFLLATALGCGLWFAKNWVLTGNPTYPLLASVLDGKTRDKAKDDQWNRVHRPHDFSARAWAADMGRVLLGSEWLSPLVMPLAALGLIVRDRRRLVLALLAWFAFIISVWWLLTHRIDRFWLPSLTLVALMAGVGAQWSDHPIWRRALIVMLLFASGSNLLMATTGPGGVNRYFVSLDRLRSSPDRIDPWHAYFNRMRPPGVVLLVGDAQVFDLEIPVLYNTCFDDSIFEQLVKGRSPEEVRRELAERKISYVYVHWGEIARYRDSGYGYTEFVQPEVFDRLVENGVLEPLQEIRGHPGRAYRVR